MLIAALSLSGCNQQVVPAPASPTPTQSKTRASVEPTESPSEQAATVVEIIDGKFELTIPNDWRVLSTQDFAEGQTVPDYKFTYEIKNSKGDSVARLEAGYMVYMDYEFGPIPEQKNVLVDYSDDAIAGQHYSFVVPPGDDAPRISISGFGDKEMLEKSPNYALPFNLNRDSDALFYREFGDDDELPGVDSKLTGVQRAKAYAQTQEYEQLKRVMLSLKASKKKNTTSTASSTENGSARGTEAGACVGAEYTYDLASGVSCEDAKSTWATLLTHRPSTGGVEVLGTGTCRLGEYEMKDGKIVAESGECLIHSGGEFSFKHK